MSDNAGRKDDAGKTAAHLFSVPAFLGTSRILAFGANKYEPRNWEKGILYSRVYSALLRHMMAWWQCEELDEETGESHLLHAMCCVMFLAHFSESGGYETFDDRPTP